MTDDPILERLVTERLEGAADPARAATELLGLVAAELTAVVGARETAAVLYAIADTSAAAPLPAISARQAADQAVREHRAAELLRPHLGGLDSKKARGAARLLLHLLDRGGRRSPPARLLEAVRDPFGTREPGDGLVKVVVCHARKALAAAGVGSDALVTVYSRGVMIPESRLAAVRALVEPRHG